ncbi:MAG: beta-ketoacyl synthase N-terminal-like domain-containing protein, partial [Bacteroidales bacterium]|nr:beta-ketoacyl synthase N-terminal-like domain-containing protein [Bacteroidales bacterium]
MNETIVVSGMGIITGLGYGKEATITALRSKRSGIGKMHYLNTIHADYPVGEVKMSDEKMREFLGIPADKIITRTPLLGIMAIKEAIKEAQLEEKRPRRIAFINGTTVGGMEKSEQYYPEFVNTEAYIAAHDCGTSCEAIAETFEGFDLITTISTACSSAANAIILGANLLKTGRVDAAVVGGTECLSKFHLNGFSTLMILDKEAC